MDLFKETAALCHWGENRCTTRYTYVGSYTG